MVFENIFKKKGFFRYLNQCIKLINLIRITVIIIQLSLFKHLYNSIKC